MIRFFLPAYNEEVALPRLVRKIADLMKEISLPYQILVLDDGSHDNTLDCARSLGKDFPVEAAVHEKNAGLGLTLRDGLRRMADISDDQDLIVTMDCDDTHEPQFLPAAFKKMKEGYDCVVLSRFQKGGGQEGLSSVKTLLSMGAGLFLKIFFPIRGVREYSCVYRVVRASVYKEAFRVFGDDFIRLTNLGFVASPEILIKFRMLGKRITEAPFVLRYDQKPTASKNNSIMTIRGYFALIVHYWLRSPKKK